MWRLLRKIIGSEDPAESATPKLMRRSVRLSPTAAGVSLAAKGRAEIDQESEWQRFVVEVKANIGDGAVLTLVVNGRRVAPIEISGSRGTFEIATSEPWGLEGGLEEVERIETVEIATREGAIILSGAFARSESFQ